MPAAPAPPETKLAEGFREGSRWVNRRPTGEDIATWFKDNVQMHDEGLDPADYVGGVTMIGANERVKEAREAANGSIQFVDVQRYVWTPYVKVETRVAYFWDLLAIHDEWVGAIEPVEMARLDAAGVYNLNLPPGFYRLPIQVGAHDFSHYLGCTMQVKIYKADSLQWVDIHRTITDTEGRSHELVESVLRGIPVAIYPPATKQIAILKDVGEEDPFATMKAETGAIGRALGMAGMLVIPGSGIATAEDMHEAQAGAAGAAVQGAALPDPAPAPEEAQESLDERIQGKIAELQSASDTSRYEKLAEWAKERKVDLAKPAGTQLRGLELQLDRLLKGATPVSE